MTCEKNAHWKCVRKLDHGKNFLAFMLVCLGCWITGKKGKTRRVLCARTHDVLTSTLWTVTIVHADDRNDDAHVCNVRIHSVGRLCFDEMPQVFFYSQRFKNCLTLAMWVRLHEYELFFVLIRWCDFFILDIQHFLNSTLLKYERLVLGVVRTFFSSYRSKCHQWSAGDA